MVTNEVNIDGLVAFIPVGENKPVGYFTCQCRVVKTHGVKKLIHLKPGFF